MNLRDSEESDRCVIEVLSRHSSEGTEERLKTCVNVVGGLLHGKWRLSKNSFKLTGTRICYFT